MLRRLNITGAIVSALLCVTLCAIWARVYPIPNGIPLSGRFVHWRLMSWNGRIGLDDKPRRHGIIDVWTHEMSAGLVEWERRHDKTNELYSVWRELRTPMALAAYETADAEEGAQGKMVLAMENRDPRWTPPTSHTLPIYPLVIATSLWPAGTFFLFLRRRMMLRRRRREGLCLHCGYDLRATPAGDTLLSRCPECGRESVTLNANSAPTALAG